MCGFVAVPVHQLMTLWYQGEAVLGTGRFSRSVQKPGQVTFSTAAIVVEWKDFPGCCLCSSTTAEFTIAHS